MERSSKRGKIPQQDWPSIMARHAAGETLASIARTYDCSPPAISYIVSRSRARNVSAEAAGHAAAATAEPQLVKAHAPEPPPAAASEWAKPAEIRPAPALVPTPPPLPPRIDSRDEAQKPGPRLVVERPPPGSEPRPREGNGNGRYFSGQPDAEGPAHAAADPRRTLRLPLSSGAEATHHPTPPVQRPPVPQGFAPPPRQQPAGVAASANPAPPVRVLPEPPKNREGGAIDAALRERVAADVAVFLDAFDTALAQDSSETRAQLREATDRLLRAGARTRIELERLEARVPLPPRERERERERYDQDAVGWRQR